MSIASGLRFRVYGRPQQRGSKKAFVLPGKDGKKPRAIITDDNTRSEPWVNAVACEAAKAMNGRDLITGPVSLSLVFFFARPKDHYGTGRNAGTLKNSAPQWHTQTPDLAKLVRCFEDALTGIVWRDDRQVFEYQSITKCWTTGQERAEAEITPV